LSLVKKRRKDDELTFFLEESYALFAGKRAIKELKIA
jgi:hypothetical protein